METDEELRRRARKTAEEKTDFYMHFGIYIAVNALIIAIWYATGMGFPWFIFPLFGWGIGLLAHFIGAFTGNSYVDRLAEKEYQKLKGNK